MCLSTETNQKFRYGGENEKVIHFYTLRSYDSVSGSLRIFIQHSRCRNSRCINCSSSIRFKDTGYLSEQG